jgi:hypothetical protein
MNSTLYVLLVAVQCVQHCRGYVQNEDAIDLNDKSLSTNGICPFGCACHHDDVTCTSLREVFPVRLPRSTASLTIQNSWNLDIPPAALEYFSSLKRVLIESSSLRRIRACAFSQLQNMTSISLLNLTIGSIDNNAFAEIQHVGTLEIRHSVIDTIEQSAFIRLRNFTRLALDNVTITTVKSHAFRQLSNIRTFELVSNVFKVVRVSAFIELSAIARFTMTSNTIQSIQCGSIENIIAGADDISIHKNRFVCDCQLSWLIDDNNFDHYKEGNSCYEPMSLNDVPLDRLSRADVCTTATDSKTQDGGCPTIKAPFPASTCRKNPYDVPLIPRQSSRESSTSSASGQSSTRVVGYIWVAVHVCPLLKLL